MRRFSCAILSALLLITLFAGCAGKDEPSIKICGFSDSIPENSHRLEYRDWSEKAFHDPKAERRVSLSIGNLAVAGDYVETERRFSEFYETRKYKDAEDHYFYLTDDGQLCTYFFGDRSDEGGSERARTESDCIGIASAFVSHIVDVSDYRITAAFDEARRMYTVSFVKYADGFRCADRADVMVDETGRLYSFSSTMLGRIPTGAATNFDREELQERIVSKLDREYSKARKAYDKVAYETFDYELTMDEDGAYALICSIDVACVRAHDGYDSQVSERIQLLVR